MAPAPPRPANGQAIRVNRPNLGTLGTSLSLRKISDFYSFCNEIGDGGYAKVYRATHKASGKEVAVKKMVKVKDGRNNRD